jgi:hypothetical protein
MKKYDSGLWDKDKMLELKDRYEPERIPKDPVTTW